MSTKHSELIGSFNRRGRFPLESDYVFSSKAMLDEWIEKPENQAITHEGLIKVVSDATDDEDYYGKKDHIRVALYIAYFDVHTSKYKFKLMSTLFNGSSSNDWVEVLGLDNSNRQSDDFKEEVSSIFENIFDETEFNEAIQEDGTHTHGHYTFKDDTIIKKLISLAIYTSRMNERLSKIKNVQGNIIGSYE